jgi:DNA polymerase II large subunit
MKTEEYFKKIDKKVAEHYDIARQARKKGFDPIDDVETPIAKTLAEKSVGLISVLYPQLQGNQKCISRILELEEKYGQLDATVAFKISEEIAKEKFCKFKDLKEAIEAGIRVGFSYMTLGVVSSPIEGFTGLEFGKTKSGKEYFKAYFSGPIRSAGTTAGCVALMIIDYLREVFGFEKYDPNEDEVKRYITENLDYHERVTNLQYLPTEEEMEYLAKGLPIQIAGEPTEQREVSNYKDLERVETNFIRGGMCLIFSEGLAQKAHKGMRLWNKAKENGLEMSGWDYLEGYVELHEKGTSAKSKGGGKPTYIKDIVAGRPVFSHPSRSGGFRFRYGRSRTGGFSATLVHPATMGVSNSFLSSGTQLKIEKPTKGCAITVCDDIDGPIVKLRNGSVKKLKTGEEAKKIYKDVDEIVYFGDILFPLGDVINRNFDLIKPGYVEEWWGLELEKKSNGKENLDYRNVSFEDSFELGKNYGLPMHPSYIYFWTQIEKEGFYALLDWVSRGNVSEEKLVLPWKKEDRERFSLGKRSLELLGCEHEVYLENVVLSKEDTKGFLFNIGVDLEQPGDFEEKMDEIFLKLKEFGWGDVLGAVNSLAFLKIKDKAGSFIGARMGRPEKAKLRKLTGSPNVLFPVGYEGGRLRSFQSAYENGSVKSVFPNFVDKVGEHQVYKKNHQTGEDYKIEKENGFGFSERRIDIRRYFDEAKKIAGVSGDEIPIVKGVRGTSNEGHDCEFLVKGLLRAKYNLAVNKDGTIRYDMTEMAVTHFKPVEIGTSVKKLRGLGYEKDIYGNKLENEEQVLELLPHDVIFPSCPETLDERADDVFLRIANFVDEELEKIYGLERYFNAKTKEDLIGELVVSIAPHICTATVGRLIGFSKIQALLASPFMHAAMRRDCDGDEAASILLMDMLLNFSKKFLPAHRGGTQDSPLVLNTRIRAGEVDDQILDFIIEKYPLELYELAEQGKHSSEIKVGMVSDALKEGKEGFVGIKYTHECSDFNSGVRNSSYKLLPTMEEKVSNQMNLCSKLRAVDTSDVARLVIERHFIRDTRGNLRKFSMQGFRCVNCNDKYRRVPLSGKCNKCGGKLIFTISEGSILKYMQRSLDLAREYKVSNYLLESLELTEMYIQSIFGREKEKQEALGNWMK